MNMHAQQMSDWTKKWDAMLSKERFSLLEQGRCVLEVLKRQLVCVVH